MGDDDGTTAGEVPVRSVLEHLEALLAVPRRERAEDESDEQLRAVADDLERAIVALRDGDRRAARAEVALVVHRVVDSWPSASVLGAELVALPGAVRAAEARGAGPLGGIGARSGDARTVRPSTEASRLEELVEALRADLRRSLGGRSTGADDRQLVAVVDLLLDARDAAAVGDHARRLGRLERAVGIVREWSYGSDLPGRVLEAHAAAVTGRTRGR